VNGAAGAPVVAGIDGSPRGLDAVEVAAIAAAHRHRPLRIVHAAETATEFPEEYLSEAALLAEKVAPEVSVAGELLAGPPVPALLAESGRAALLVVGDRGLGGFPGLIIGSVAVHVATHAACPVLIVRGHYRRAGPVVVGIDGSAGSVRALELAIAEAERRDSDVVAVEARPGTDPAAVKAALAAATDRHPGVAVRHEVAHDAAGHALTRWSRSAQLLVVGDRGHGGFPGLQLGSVTQHVVQHAVGPTAVARASS
jgi:nucleotide-binding universal stress UspA family protein